MNDAITMGVAFSPYHKQRTPKPMHRDRPFVAWDGEGITHTGEVRQSFVLFGNSLGYKAVSRRLSSQECLDLIIQTEQDHPHVIHVGFAFTYDVEMMLADLSVKHLKMLHAKGHVLWRAFRIEFKRGKWLQITKRIGDERVTARIYDVWGFFQCSFVKAVTDNISAVTQEKLDELAAMKAGRRTFVWEEMDSAIIPYWQSELAWTEEMMTVLRSRLYDAELNILQWHGPGAIATYAYRTRKVEPHMDRGIQPEVNEAAQSAYAGGRFELFKVGRHRGKVYRYDIRSAYPSAMVHLPSLTDSRFRWVDNPDPRKLARFGVYRISYANPHIFSSMPQPFFYRDPRYAIHFPNVVQGWYWTPEAENVRHLKGATITGGWELIEPSDDRPFSWVDGVYETRAQWKRDGNPSQMALKLLLNSLYGKMAQRVGWEQTGDAPKWHQLEWAGYVTSFTRAKLYSAMIQAYRKGALIGVETDGIFTTEPLDLDIGPSLGQWEADEFDGMVYLQSGFYFLDNAGKWTAKYRGFDKASVDIQSTLAMLDDWQPWQGERGVITGETTRFSTMGTYLRSPDPDDKRNTWSTSPRELVIGATGKRVHRPAFCSACQSEQSPGSLLHSTVVTYPIGGESVKHSLPWLHAKGADPNPYRETDDDYDQHYI